jgi:hypothetical protein
MLPLLKATRTRGTVRPLRPIESALSSLVDSQMALKVGSRFAAFVPAPLPRLLPDVTGSC